MCNNGTAHQSYGEKIGEQRGAEEAIIKTIKNLRGGQ